MTGEPVAFDTLCAALVGEPWHLSLDQIRKLTPYQANHIYWHPRDNKGNLQTSGPGRQQTYEEIFRNCWQRRGLGEAEIEAKWQEYLKGQEKRG